MVNTSRLPKKRPCERLARSGFRRRAGPGRFSGNFAPRERTCGTAGGGLTGNAVNFPSTLSKARSFALSTFTLCPIINTIGILLFEGSSMVCGHFLKQLLYSQPNVVSLRLCFVTVF